MKYIEYVWLASAFLLMVFLAKDFGYLRPLNILVLIAGILISGFMFAYRRQARIHQEKRQQEALEQLHEDTPSSPQKEAVSPPTESNLK